ncbi:MAG: hypothetical protein LBK02_05055, partial [Treponema sp.]|nr:hypothetical protein [Treponema sp.]
MKKHYKLLGIIAIGVAIGAALMGCPNLSGGNENNGGPQTAIYISTDSDGNRYTLTITGNTNRAARYAAQTGDGFVLTIELFSNETYSLALTYSGTIDLAQNDGTEITLSLSVNGQPLSITINGTTMTVITGTIILDNGETITAPEEVTPVVPDVPVITDVYVAGSYGAGIPCYWKNGVKTDLPLTEGEYRSSADKIIVDGTDIYVLGYVDNGSRSLGCYWKNGTLTLLSNNGYARGFAVSNGVVYVVGSYEVFAGDGYISRPCYWINGAKTDLFIGEYNQIEAPAIAVAGGTVYIAGTYVVPDGNGEGTWYACYWRDGIRTDISATDSYARAMAVSGNDVFMAGWRLHDGSAWYSKNTNVYSLARGNSSAYAIAVSGSDVYIAGFSGNGSTRQASYWKNFTLNMLPGTSAGKDSFAYGITVVNGDVY